MICSHLLQPLAEPATFSLQPPLVVLQGVGRVAGAEQLGSLDVLSALWSTSAVAREETLPATVPSLPLLGWLPPSHVPLQP